MKEDGAEEAAEVKKESPVDDEDKEEKEAALKETSKFGCFQLVMYAFFSCVPQIKLVFLVLSSTCR